MQDVLEKDEEVALRRQYSRPKGSRGRGNQMQSDEGFMVRGGPWSAATEDFPSLGEGAKVAALPKKMQWGPSMLGPKLPGTK